MQTVCDWLDGSFAGPGNRKECACPGRQNNQFFRQPAYWPAMTGRGASLALFLYDIHAGLPDRHDGPICRPVNPRVAHRLYWKVILPILPVSRRVVNYSVLYIYLGMPIAENFNTISRRNAIKTHAHLTTDICNSLAIQCLWDHHDGSISSRRGMYEMSYKRMGTIVYYINFPAYTCCFICECTTLTFVLCSLVACFHHCFSAVVLFEGLWNFCSGIEALSKLTCSWFWDATEMEVERSRIVPVVLLMLESTLSK